MTAFSDADRAHMARALVQQLDDLRVELVDGLAMLRNVHKEGRMWNLE